MVKTIPGCIFSSTGWVGGHAVMPYKNSMSAMNKNAAPITRTLSERASPIADLPAVNY
ncbi:MAG: hypothetical protein GY789_08230 [Hyphomicrobiales bacterium]|nr:hypothetical protein [Hyphomicrobiales bacterium]MCP4998078.1 hypothetical protein [Hyphomicrobiales bacterium]